MAKAFAEIAEMEELTDDEGIANMQFAHGFLQHGITGVRSDTEFQIESNIGCMFKQSNRSKLDLRKVILLDSQSTIDLFCNPDMVRDIRPAESSMKLQSNGGVMTLTHKATLPGYHTDVWYSKDAICNILGLCNVKKQYRISYDSNDGGYFTVHRDHPSHPDMTFHMHSCGLHVFDPNDYSLVTKVSPQECVGETPRGTEPGVEDGSNTVDGRTPVDGRTSEWTKVVHTKRSSGITGKRRHCGVSGSSTKRGTVYG
jgi:hypothetical protein